MWLAEYRWRFDDRPCKNTHNRSLRRMCVRNIHCLLYLVGSGLRPTYSLLGVWPNSLGIWPNYMFIAYAAHAHAYRFATARTLTAADNTSLSSGHSFTQLLSRVRDVWPFVQLFVDNFSSTELTLKRVRELQSHRQLKGSLTLQKSGCRPTDEAEC